MGKPRWLDRRIAAPGPHLTLCLSETDPGREQEAYAIQAIAQELMAEFARRMTA